MKEFISKIERKWKAYRYNVPFRNKVWYNYIAMFQRSEWGGKDYIEIFDKDGRYIDCPNIGGLVKYRYKGYEAETIARVARCEKTNKATRIRG